MADAESARLRVVAGPGYWSARAVMRREAWAAERPAALVDEGAIVAELRRRAPRRGMRKRLAHELGITAPWLCQVINRRRPVSRKLAERLGYRLIKPESAPRFERVE